MSHQRAVKVGGFDLEFDYHLQVTASLASSEECLLRPRSSKTNRTADTDSISCYIIVDSSGVLEFALGRRFSLDYSFMH